MSLRLEKKSGNDMLVPVKTAELLEVKKRGAKIHLEHMNWKEKDRSEVMHVQSLADPFSFSILVFIFAAVQHSLRTRRSSALNTADKLFQFHSGPAEQMCGSITFHR